MNRVASYALLLAMASLGYAEPPAAAGGFRWERLPDLPLGVVAPAAHVQDDHLYVSGGVVLSGEATDMVQVMDLRAKKWVRTHRLAHPRYNHGQVELDDGRLLLVGGHVNDRLIWFPPLKACEIFDPAAGTSRAVADLPEPIGMPSLHRLDDGRIVAAGDHIVSIFDPVTEAWSAPIRLRQMRREHAALLVGPRKLLLIAGTGMRTFERVHLDVGRVDYDLHPALPSNIDDLRVWRLSDGRLWVIGGQFITGVTTDRTWLVSLTGTGDPRLVEDGPSLNVPGGISDHILVETRWGLVAAGGEAEDATGHDTELATALLLDPDPSKLTVRRLPDLSVPHDDAAAVAWEGTVIVIGGQTTGTLLGVEVPTPVRAVEMLVRDGGDVP